MSKRERRDRMRIGWLDECGRFQQILAEHVLCIDSHSFISKINYQKVIAIQDI